MLDFIAKPMGWVMHLFYNLVAPLDNKYLSAYAMAIILSTLVIKFLVLPLTLKQTKSMKIMQQLSPKIKDLQEKYSKDPQTLQRKQMELYKAEKYNPLSGCLPMLIQFPIIIAFFYVIKDPKFAFAGMGHYVKLTDLATQIGLNLDIINKSLQSDGQTIIKTLDQLYKYAQANNIDYSSISQAVTLGANNIWLWTENINRSFFWIHDLGFASNYIFTNGTVNGLFIGVSLPLFGSALPILAGFSAYSTYVTTKMMSKNQVAMNAQAQSTNKMMSTFMPIVIFVTAVNFPSGLALYWVVSNVFQLLQQYIVLNSSK